MLSDKPTQAQVDQAENKSNVSQPPDDSRKADGKLHRTNGRERKHRDRGQIQDSDRLRAIKSGRIGGD